MIKNHLRKLNKGEDFNEVTTSLEVDNLLSTTTTPTITDSQSAKSSSTASASLNNDITPSLDHTSQKQPGRPKGTTKKQSQDLEHQIKLASEEAADRYSESRKRARSRNRRARKGELTSIIRECKEKHSVPDDIIIDPECIRSRVKRGKHHGGISGNTSPMDEIEPYLVELIGQLEKMRVPISCRQGLALANSIISGTSHESRVIA